MRFKCRMCSNQVDGYCTAKKTGGKHPKVKLNKYRKCSLFVMDPDAAMYEAEKEAARRALPINVPTWRYYATKKELRECGEQDKPKFIRIEDARLKNIFVGGTDGQTD